ncbi:hypothetical protein JTE90_002789 [Oedothorax gibbosus]|uniref:TP53-regulated inhibitor of apoptosis 1 n=1 Tax=Oedothorax gibbosus TaxID=931172 RepID=A0AAV6UHM3_9ARAC|nr:hypothetical protein JTE90_002789 [Oedothorax gibbosus]
MDSIGKDCKELKSKYEACFNSWYSESFLKNKNGDISVCDPLFKEYQDCLNVALKKNKIPLRELNGDVSIETDNKQSAST